MTTTSSNYHSDHQQSGFASGLFLGLVLGGTLAYFFHTPRGKQLLSQLKKTAADSLQDNQTLQTKLAQMKRLVDQLETKLPSSTKPRFFHKDGTPLKPKA